nr:40S ribosomal protein S25 [Cryptomonas curvata]
MSEKAKRKKWSKGKSKEKTNNLILIDSENYDRILREIFKNKVLTPSNLSERFHISCSLSKKILKDLANKKLIFELKKSSKQSIYVKNNP